MVHIRFPFHWHLHIHHKTDGVHALYANFFFRELAIYTFGIFQPLYLLKIAQDNYGATLAEAFAFIAIFYLGVRTLYVFLALPVVNIITHIGTRWSIFISNFFLVLYLASLTLGHKYGGFIIAAMLFGAIYIPFYWISFHYLMSADSHDQSRGSEVSRTRVIERVGAIIGPLLGGFVTANLGFAVLFGLSIVLILVSSIPPFFMYHHEHTSSYSLSDVASILGRRTNRGTLVSTASSAIVGITDSILIPVFVFLLLTGYEKTGLLFSATGVLTIGIYWLIGWLFDNHSREKLLQAGVGLNFLVWIGRSLTTFPLMLYFVESAKRITNPIMLVTHDAMVYYWGKKEPLAHMLARAFIWQLSAVLWLFLLMVGFWFGIELRAVFALTAFIVLGHLFIMKK